MMSWATQSAAFIGEDRGEPHVASRDPPSDSVMLGMAVSVGRNAVAGVYAAPQPPGGPGAATTAHAGAGGGVLGTGSTAEQGRGVAMRGSSLHAGAGDAHRTGGASSGMLPAPPRVDGAPHMTTPPCTAGAPRHALMRGESIANEMAAAAGEIARFTPGSLQGGLAPPAPLLRFPPSQLLQGAAAALAAPP